MVRSSIRLDWAAAPRISLDPSPAISPTLPANSGERASRTASPSMYSAARRAISSRTASSTGTSPPALSRGTGVTASGGVSVNVSSVVMRFP